MLLMIPSASNKRVLHPGIVLESAAPHVICQLEEVISPEPGSNLIAFGLLKDQFHQQAVRVVAYRPTPKSPIIELLCTGDPVSAEQRQVYRVSAASLDVRAKVGKEPSCLVVDISAEGFGAIVATEHQLGSIVQVLFSVDEHTMNAAVRVQTVRQRGDGKYRCGFLVAEKGNPARKALNSMSLAMQRRQLRRMAGAA